MTSVREVSNMIRLPFASVRKHFLVPLAVLLAAEN